MSQYNEDGLISGTQLSSLISYAIVIKCFAIYHIKITWYYSIVCRTKSSTQHLEF